MTEERTPTSKLLKLFSVTLEQRLVELASPAANSMADMQH